jgi:3-oxoacyl-[acyl-carrier protein] reductase
MKKKILLIGSNSDIAKALIFDNEFNFIKLSSKESEFNILDKTTFPVIDNLDGLVYFPGSINLKPFENLKSLDFSRDYELNVLGLINIIQFYQKSFNKDSSLIFISSVAAKIGMKFHASITMCKSAIEGLSRALAAEFSPNIRVNCVAPSIVDTKLSSKILRSDKTRDLIANNHPLKRIGSVNDISNAISFLLSNKSSWITGQTMHVDGGMSSINL